MFFKLQLLTTDIEKDNPLNRLPYATDAPFNAYSRQHEPTCLSNTRVDLLHEIQSWVSGQDERFIFWLNGFAGTGKSTIARTIARKYFDEGRLGASFFFSKGGGDVGHASKFCTTIAVELAKKSETLQHYICDAIQKNSNIASQSLSDQWNHLVLRPLSLLTGDLHPPSYILVVDALDECEDKQDIQIILQLLAEAQSLNRVQLRVLITSRPELSIRHSFNQIPMTTHRDYVLHSLSPSIIDHDITIYLEFNLQFLAQEHSLGNGWPGEETIKILVQRANGLFIWAATAYRLIREGGKRRFIRQRLSTILEASTSISGPEEQLNKIYLTVLKQSLPVTCSAMEREELLSILRTILGCVVVLLSPLSVLSLTRLLDLQREDVDDSLEGLHTILDIPKDESRPIRLHHPSFRDFLLNKDRCNDLSFFVDQKQAHQGIVSNCIQLMSASLTEDICGVTVTGFLVTDIDQDRINQCLSPEVQYACLYWIEHLQKSDIQLADNDQVHQFLQNHFLHWLEALSWMQMISEGILRIITLETMARVRVPPTYFKRLLIMYSRKLNA
jgi:NACHT domain-containing protein